MHNNYPTKQTTARAGEIQIKESKRGIEFHSFNFERQRMLHIGTLTGSVYEKVAAILRQPEPSFSMTQSEYGAAVETGAVYLRIVPPDKSATYSISLENFRANAQDYFNPGYGPQLRCPLKYFSQTNRTGKRNSVTDNPPLQIGREFEKPQAEQLPLFIPRPRFDQSGNYQST